MKHFFNKKAYEEDTFEATFDTIVGGMLLGVNRHTKD